MYITISNDALKKMNLTIHLDKKNHIQLILTKDSNFGWLSFKQNRGIEGTQKQRSVSIICDILIYEQPK